MGTVVRTGSRALVGVACLLLAFSATDTGPGVTQPEVDTPLGRVRGRQVGVKGTDRLVNVFLGIPFAQPPLGPHRFSAPRPAESWEGVRDASRAHAVCPQDPERMNNSRFTLDGKHQTFPISEDCLILNIYSPAEAPSGAGRPVMVWFHGGSLVTGTATSHDGSALAAYGDVVVVTVQYRLGFLGFFSTGDKHAPGNWGFLDVMAALRWVQGNITPFGGDFNSVTIFGESSGASVVSALVLSPLAAGLFHRAIAQSGIITVPGLLDPNPWLLAQTLADSLACNSDSSAEMVQCLRQKTIKEMILAYKSKKIASYNIDGTFFPKSAEELLRERQFPSVPFLFGFNNHEFGWLIPRGWGFLDKMDQLSLEDMLAILRPSLTNMDVPTEVMPTIIKEYLGSSSDGQAKREALQELLSDIIITLPMLQFARDLQDSGVSIFFYEFQHRPSSFAKIKPAWVQADHGAELTFMFGGPFLTDESSMLAFPEATEEEKQLSLTMMAQWTNFAWTGDPNGKGLPLWPPFNHAEEYLEISLVPRVNQKPREARMQLWEEILPTKFGQWQQKQKGKKVQEEL
ncbi:carboxylesterase 3 isoform X1 [Bos indicus x Bos taurus]|uniref:Carboxylic ester hydrolase n=2 Tax=Bos indicus x Bos taurus TaxID=30522 RepID=A0A4W2GGN4_BOBOX|nr:carboxylesterase 3 isoform X1 [Bos indicus x Bos taurus]